MASVFLRWPNGVVQMQPAEVAEYFVHRGAEIVEDPAIAAAKSAVEAAAAAAVAEPEVDADAVSPSETGQSAEAVQTTGLGRPSK